MIEAGRGETEGYETGFGRWLGDTRKGKGRCFSVHVFETFYRYMYALRHILKKTCYSDAAQHRKLRSPVNDARLEPCKGAPCQYSFRSSKARPSSQILTQIWKPCLAKAVKAVPCAHPLACAMVQQFIPSNRAF